MLAVLQTAHNECVRFSCYAHDGSCSYTLQLEATFLLFIPLNLMFICQCLVLYMSLNPTNCLLTFGETEQFFSEFQNKFDI